MMYIDDNIMLQLVKTVIFTTCHHQERFVAKQAHTEPLNISYTPAKTEIIHLSPQTLNLPPLLRRPLLALQTSLFI